MGYRPAPANLQPKVRPDEVKGYLGQQHARPDRLFHILENSSHGYRVWQVDGYCLRDGVEHTERWRLHLICPICEKGLTIESEKKAINVSDRGLEVEGFRCRWPGDFGSPMCKFAAGVRLPRDGERVVPVDNDPRPRRIDGVFVPA